MILTKEAIRELMTYKDIVVEPFDERFMNPNGYDLHLSDTLLLPCIYDPNAVWGMMNYPKVWDVREEIQYDKVVIPEEGYVLQPGKLYLGSTIEYTDARNTVPVFEGKSSIGRMGMDVHICAGFGDVGFAGFWTLELRVIYPTRIYAGMPIGQLVWHKVHGEINGDYSQVGNYAGQKGQPTPTKLWKNFDSKLLKV